MRNLLRRLRAWRRPELSASTTDPYADALRLRARPIRRTLAELSAERIADRASRPDGESLAQQRRAWS